MLGIILPSERVLITFPIAVIVHFLRNLVIITGFSSSESLPKRVSGVKKTVCVVRPCFASPTWNESVLMDGLDAERTAPVKTKMPSCAKNLNLCLHCNRSKIKKRCFGILAMIEPRLAASFEYVEACVFQRISCSMFCERFQQYWPFRVPMKLCVRLTFILIVMTNHSCNLFGDRCWQISSMRCFFFVHR